MLAGNEAIATVAVKDLKAARKFYEGTLGLREKNVQGGAAVTYGAGGSDILVYQSEFAGTNQATAATWSVGDVEAEVRQLRAKGITFEHYDMPGMTRKGDVHVAGDMKAAWFKDPDGNIHALVSG